MALSVIPITILGQITGVTGSGETALYQVSFKSIDGTPLYGVTTVWTDEQAEIEALAAQKPYGVWINPIDGTFTVKFAGYTYVGSADLTDSDVLAGITPIEFTNQSGGSGLPAVTTDDDGKMLQVESGEWKIKNYPISEVVYCNGEYTSNEQGSGIELTGVELTHTNNDKLNLIVTNGTTTYSAEIIWRPLAREWIDSAGNISLSPYEVDNPDVYYPDLMLDDADNPLEASAVYSVKVYSEDIDAAFKTAVNKLSTTKIVTFISTGSAIICDTPIDEIVDSSGRTIGNIICIFTNRTTAHISQTISSGVNDTKYLEVFFMEFSGTAASANAPDIQTFYYDGKSVTPYFYTTNITLTPDA